MEFHDIANIFPMMIGDDYRALVVDIRENGLREPITIYEGKILDGRNRYAACLECGIEPDYQEWNGKGSPIGYVISLNLQRRHLTSSQRAAISLDLERMYAVEAKERMLSGKCPDPTEIIPQGEAAEKAAADMNTNAHYVKDAKMLAEKAPELLAQVKVGEITIPKAIQEMRRREVLSNLESIDTQQAKAIEGVYDVIVIDPPWDMQKIEREERVNQVAFEYPTMTEEELGELNIPTAEDCHVWLWTTHKYLPMALRLLERWGLKYICTFVWHKPGGFQPYGLPQFNCEFALYAHKGAPMFIDQKDFMTCFEAQRGAHSEKPEEFYDTIRRVTGGRRLDMFSRRSIEGFDGWGKEAK